ncbi:MAG TPA: zinc-binding dehydrogenase [Candidatus Gastranaerophilales bacterium]|nr:zinc-binding dehydrogenase [Candidatus Gastranaerophilales bacterium]
MKTAVLKDQSKKLYIEDMLIPKPDKNELLIKVAACGLCHTDLHYLDHGVSTFKKPPVILGHEATGIVMSGGEVFKEGDRVLLPPVFTCGNCKFCLSERENICQNMIMLGNSIDGAFAQFIKVPEKDVMLLPDEIPLEEGCIIADAISTPYHAVINRAKVKPSERVIVFGCGGVGINVVQICAMLKAEVIACDIDNKKLDIAKELGAALTINPAEVELKEFLKQNGGLVDVAFEVIGKPETIEAAFKTLNKAGRLCVIGYTNQEIKINPAKIMFFEQEILGSIGCRPSDFPKIFDLIKDKKINLDKLVSNKYKLDEINLAFEELRDSKVLRNIVLPNV